MVSNIKKILTKQMEDLNLDTPYMDGYKDGIKFVIKIIDIDEE